MKIFVTGATGYLGYHFAKQALKKGHKILCLKRKTSKSLFEDELEKKVLWVTKDDNMRDTVCSFQPDVLFHAAWSGVRGSGRGDKEIQFDNVVMSRELFSLYNYRQIISIGSQAEYGYYSESISEDHPLNPTMEYAKAKVQCCNELNAYCEGKNIEWQWIRIFTVFGEKQTGGLIKLAIEKCLKGEKSFNTTPGEQNYSYLYAEDFGNAICNMLGSEGKSGIYNLSQPKCIKSNKEILEAVKTITRSGILLNFGAIPYTEGQVMLMDGNVEKYEKAFGRVPYTDFETALTKTINSFGQ